MVDVRPFAAVVLVVRNGLVLSVSRKGCPSEKGLPGGRIEDMEDPEDAARRELMEETGLSVGNMSMVFDSVDDTGVRVLAFQAVSFVDPGPDESFHIDSEKETGLVEWVTPEELVSSSPFSEFNAALFAAVGITAGARGL